MLQVVSSSYKLNQIIKYDALKTDPPLSAAAENTVKT